MAQISPQEWRLVATQEGLPLYQKLGFEPCGEVQQHQGIARAALQNGPEVWAGDADARCLAALDQAATGMQRAWLMEALLRHGRVLVQREGGEVAAFAGLRRFGRGDLVGPVVARSETKARAMLATLLTVSAGRFLRVDLAEGVELGPYLAEHGLVPVGSGTVMRRGSGQPIGGGGSHRRFALVAQALG
jgi:hypothetical protein